MKKIIDGKRYDTESADLIGFVENPHTEGVMDFRHWSAGLYVTPRSRTYFLAGEGGPLTQFSRRVGDNTRIGGSGVIPLTREQAMEWAALYLDIDTVESYFADMIEDA